MQKFTGTKTILAKPMTRAEYIKYRGWVLPKNENEADEGFLVEYTDGGKPNVDGHQGYVSWSPKEQFQLAYKPSGTHLERMQIERGELVEKGNKLRNFLWTDTFNSLDQMLRELLIAQLAHMEAYLRVLEERIAFT